MSFLSEEVLISSDSSGQLIQVIEFHSFELLPQLKVEPTLSESHELLLRQRNMAFITSQLESSDILFGQLTQSLLQPR